MIYKSCFCLLLFAIFGLSLEAVGKERAETTPKVEGRKITTDELALR